MMQDYNSGGFVLYLIPIEMALCLKCITVQFPDFLLSCFTTWFRRTM